MRGGVLLVHEVTAVIDCSGEACHLNNEMLLVQMFRFLIDDSSHSISTNGH